MVDSYGFEKYEGFVSSAEEFNGIIFCLRESNLKKDSEHNKDNEPTEFWFREVVTNPKVYYDKLYNKFKKDISRNKSAATWYKKIFKGMLKQVGKDDINSLRNCAFCNVNYKGGGRKFGEDYKAAKKKATGKVENIVKKSPKNELTIFTCWDIYDCLHNEWKKFEIGNIYKKGVCYKGQEAKRCFTCKIDEKVVTVFEIYHPAYRKSLI